ncbi:MAG: hypothetical protein ACK4UO_14580 [Pseudolabrys sp.]
MSVKRTRPWRHKAAALLAVLYALCLVSPVAAFAFSQAAASHCLTGAEPPKTAGHPATHGHDHGAGHDEAHAAPEHAAPVADTTDAGDQAVPGKCCGLFCVTALEPPALAVADVQAAAASAVTLLAPVPLLGRGSGRIDRPPRVLPSL